MRRDLADSDTDGRLNKDDFAVAMHLIKAALAGKEVPNALPSSLIPPPASARQVISQEEASPFNDPVPATPTTSSTYATQSAAPSAPSAQHRRTSDAERSLPPPPPEEPEPHGQHVLPPDDSPRSQTPPPPYTLVGSDPTVQPSS